MYYTSQRDYIKASYTFLLIQLLLNIIHLYYLCEEKDIHCFEECKLIVMFRKSIWKYIWKGLNLYILIDPEITPVELIKQK